MPSKKERHICSNCGRKLIVQKMTSWGRNLMNGKSMWFCIDVVECKKVSSAPGAKDT